MHSCLFYLYHLRYHCILLRFYLFYRFPTGRATVHLCIFLFWEAYHLFWVHSTGRALSWNCFVTCLPPAACLGRSWCFSPPACLRACKRLQNTWNYCCLLLPAAWVLPPGGWRWVRAPLQTAPAGAPAILGDCFHLLPACLRVHLPEQIQTCTCRLGDAGLGGSPGVHWAALQTENLPFPFCHRFACVTCLPAPPAVCLPPYLPAILGTCILEDCQATFLGWVPCLPLCHSGRSSPFSTLHHSAWRAGPPAPWVHLSPASTLPFHISASPFWNAWVPGRLGYKCPAMGTSAPFYFVYTAVLGGDYHLLFYLLPAAPACHYQVSLGFHRYHHAPHLWVLGLECHLQWLDTWALPFSIRSCSPALRFWGWVQACSPRCCLLCLPPSG